MNRRTLEDLQQELDLVKTAADHFENKVVEQWNNISARLQLDGMSWRDAMPCIMGRLSQHLYPYRPRLSILLQYWKRPAGTVNRFMEALMQCKEQVSFAPFHGTEQTLGRGAATQRAASWVCNDAATSCKPSSACSDESNSMRHRRAGALRGNRQYRSSARRGCLAGLGLHQDPGMVVPVFSYNVHEIRWPT